MRTRRTLQVLAGLLVLYLTVPVVAFGDRLVRSHQRGFTEPGLWPALSVSLQASTISLVLMTLFGVPLAYALARSRSRLAGVVGIVVQLPLAIPPIMSGVLLIYLIGPYSWLGQHFDRNLTESLTGVIIAQTFVSVPFLVVAARSAFEAIDPALDDLAAACGHRPLARFWQIDLRGAAGGIRAGMVLAWLRAFGEYGAVVILSYHPFSLPVYTEQQFSSTGLPTTQAPTFLALAIAAAAIYLGRARWHGRRRPVELPAKAAPPAAGPVPIAFDIDATIGEFRLQLAYEATSHRLAIVGPSGSGKSVSLRVLAGVLPGAGTVRYADTDVSDVPPEERQIGYVPQGASLLPGRTVWQQVNFATGVDPSRASWWLETLRIDELTSRLPTELSGGQGQRASLARALARDPQVIFLDEPFSALDVPIRYELRQELHRLQHEGGLSTVLVTHDPEEAAMLADEILVIANGELLQAGPCSHVFRYPATPEIARLLRIENVNIGTAIGDGLIDTTSVSTSGTVIQTTADVPAGTSILWNVHPHDIMLVPDGPYPAVVTDLVHLGALTAVTIQLDEGAQLRAWTTRQDPPPIGEAVRAAIPADAVTVWAASAATSVSTTQSS